MDGYSVTEAASVLGVPTERVWELLARGVLSGVPDGETGMRVFLQPRPAPPAVEEPRRSNGNARETDAEASPFRELLTEFRGLTERYGQALLALGEARGEVASLRSRVDVLEARMDLRLPFASPPSPDPAWGGPSRTSSEPRPRVSDHPEAEVDGEHEGERSARRKRGRAHFSDEFADALARAEDPSPAVLRDALRAAPAAVQPDHDEATAEADVADAGLPRELPPAETMADIEPEAAPAIAESEAEPQPEAEVDLEAAAELATEPQPPPLPEPGLEVAAELATEPQPEPLPEPEPESAPEPAAESGTELQPEPDAYPEAEGALESELEPVIEPAAVEAPPAEADIEPEPELIEPEPVPAAEVAAEAEPEPELGAGAPFDSPEPEPAAAGAPEAEAEMERQPEAEPEPVAADVEAERLPAPDAVTEAEPEPELEADGASAVEDEPSLAAEFDELPDTELEPEPEPLLAAALEAAAVDEQEPEAEPEPAASDAADASAPEVEPPRDSEPSWDQERYSAQIEEPDWWTPEESVWAESAPEEPAQARDDVDEPAVPSDAVAVPSAAEAEPVSAEVHEERPSVDAAPPVAGPEEVAIVGSGDSYAGEETMLWFGRQPASSASDDAPSDDAAGEMEVASTGRRGWVTPEDGSGGMPGARELDAALAGFDSLRGRPAPATAEPSDSPTVTVPPPARPSTPATTSDVPSVVSAELRVHASRAYRRLRRIFPS